MKKVLCTILSLMMLAASFVNASAAGTATLVTDKVTTEGVSYAIWDVEVYGNYLYAADTNLGLRVFEIGENNSFTDVTPNDYAFKGSMTADVRNQLSIEDGMLFAAFAGDSEKFTDGEGNETFYSKGVRAYDLTNPKVPALVKTNNWMGSVSSILADGDLVFAGVRGGFRIYNRKLTSSANSVIGFGGRTGQPNFARNPEWAVSGNYVFYSHRPDATDGFDDYSRIDVYEISMLRETAAKENSYVSADDAKYVTTIITKTEYIEKGHIYSLACNGNYLYVGAQNAIEVYDISDLVNSKVTFVAGYTQSELPNKYNKNLSSIVIGDGLLFINFYTSLAVAGIYTDGTLVPMYEFEQASSGYGPDFVDGVLYAAGREKAFRAVSGFIGTGINPAINNRVFSEPNFSINGCAVGVDAVKVRIGTQLNYTVNVDENGCWNLPLTNQQSGAYTVNIVGVKDGQEIATTKASANYTVGTVFVEMDSKSTNFLQDGASVKVTVHKNLKYEGDYRALVAAYDNAGKLVGVKQSALYSTDAFAQKDTEEITLSLNADNIETVKAFVWTEDLMPLSVAEENDDFVVAFVGDSITHRQNYTRAIETFYTTRYPNRKISFINKGINGDNVLGATGRFKWDILNDEWDSLNGEYWQDNKKPDVITVMLGTNDLGGWDGWTSTDPNNHSSKEYRINFYLQNVENFIKTVLAEDIELILITPPALDIYEVDAQGNVDADIGRNEGLKMASDGLKELGEKYDLPVIDMFGETVKFVETVRKNYPTLDSVLANPNDVVHPTYNGGFVMGYIFAKEAAELAGDSDSAKYVSNVVIDATANELQEAQNASVTELNATQTSVSYKYLANAMPMPVSDSYENAETVFGLPITKDINNEIIKVTGLKEGEYTLTIGGNVVGVFDADEFSKGVNIAALENNPAQIKAKLAYEKINEKAERELRYRYIAEADMKNVRNSNEWGGVPMNERLTSTQEGINAFYEKVKAYFVAKYDTNADGVVSESDGTSAWGSYRWDLRLPHFYFGIADYTSDPDYYQYASKLDHEETWNGLETLKAEARSILTPEQYVVTITAVEE